MFSVIAIIAVILLYCISIYNGIAAAKRQICITRKIIQNIKDSKNFDAKKLNDTTDFHNDLVKTFNKQITIFPTKLVANLFKITPENSI